MEQYRQGDVLLIRRADGFISGKRAELTPVPDGIIALGEVTGHAHKITGAEVFRDPADETLWVQVMESGTATLTHNEHDPLTLDPGVYEVIRQREYDPLAEERKRRVLD